MSAQLRGVMAVLLTPFDANEKLDTASLISAAFISRWFSGLMLGARHG